VAVVVAQFLQAIVSVLLLRWQFQKRLVVPQAALAPA
jgi:hypothetical protein